MRHSLAADRSMPRPSWRIRNPSGASSVNRRNADADATLGVLAVRRTPVYDPFDDHDDPNHEPAPNVRRISTEPGPERPVKRAELKPLHAARRLPPRRGPDPRVWFIRGSIGVAALAGLWLALQALFPVTESRVNQAPTPALPIDASAVGAPEPPAAAAVSQPAPTLVTQPAPAAEGDRLPGLPTPDSSAAQQSAPAAPAAQQPAQAGQPAAGAPSASGQAAPAIVPSAPVIAAAPPAAEPKPREESPSQQPVGTPTVEPIPPPPSAQADAPQPAPGGDQGAAEQAARQAQEAAAAPKPQAPAPAAKPQAPAAAPPPAARSSGGPYELSASASPVNPISEQAVITITVRATQNGAPLVGASCMASIHYRTATAKQPDGGFRTNGNGVGSFTLDARNTTYGYYIPVDVTCSARGGTITARTGFTPVRGR
jgi:hypothetical protein